MLCAAHLSEAAVFNQLHDCCQSSLLGACNGQSSCQLCSRSPCHPGLQWFYYSCVGHTSHKSQLYMGEDCVPSGFPVLVKYVPMPAGNISDGCPSFYSAPCSFAAAGLHCCILWFLSLSDSPNSLASTPWLCNWEVCTIVSIR